MTLKQLLIIIRDHAFLPNDPSKPIERKHLIQMKCFFLVSNFMANIIAFVLMENLIFRGGPLPSENTTVVIHHSVTIVHAVAAFVFILFTLTYERPIRKHLDNVYERKKTPRKELMTARRRLLNEPLIVAVMDLLFWLFAAIYIAVLFKSLGEPGPVVMRMFFLSLNTGMITAVMAFFLLEHIAQWHLSPFFFPDGRQSSTPGTLRVRIVVRLLLLLLVCNIIPFLTFIQLYLFSEPDTQDLAGMMQELRTAILTNSIFFMVVGVSFTIFVHMNFAMPLREIIRVLKRVRSGDYNQRVLVTTNDELGYTGDVINEMNTGLKERERMQQSLLLAREVQQNLLPRRSPEIAGLDISGSILYCDETGGDYYDYLNIARPGENRIGIVVGDVSDHGLQSALMMISARSCIRHDILHSFDLTEMVANVNRHICLDTEETGQFMTLFVCEIDADRQTITWTRAGHDPGLLYDPGNDHFQELGGSGISLGISPAAEFQAHSLPVITGQVIVIGTDGIWEAVNRSGASFGKKRLRDIVRQHHREGADDIRQAIVDALEEFTRGVPLEDDVTMVIVTITNSPLNNEQA